MLLTVHCECCKDVVARAESDNVHLLPVLMASAHASPPHCLHTLWGCVDGTEVTDLGGGVKLDMMCNTPGCKSNPKQRSVSVRPEFVAIAAMTFHTMHEAHHIGLLVNGQQIHPPAPGPETGRWLLIKCARAGKCPSDAVVSREARYFCESLELCTAVAMLYHTSHEGHPLEILVDNKMFHPPGGDYPGDQELHLRCTACEGFTTFPKELTYFTPSELLGCAAIAFHAWHEGHPLEVWLNGRQLHPMTPVENRVRHQVGA